MWKIKQLQTQKSDTYSLYCGQSESSWWRPAWPGHWSSEHETEFHRSTLASCCEARSDFPSSYSGILSTSHHIPAHNWHNISQKQLSMCWDLIRFFMPHNTMNHTMCYGFNFLSLYIAGHSEMPDYAHIIYLSYINQQLEKLIERRKRSL